MQDLAQMSAMTAFALLAAWEVGSLLDTGSDGHEDEPTDDHVTDAEDDQQMGVDELLADSPTTLDVPAFEGSMTRLLDFDPEADRLEIEYEPKQDPESGEELIPTIEIAYSANADATAVMVDGEPWVELPGQVDIAAEDIILVPAAAAA